MKYIILIYVLSLSSCILGRIPYDVPLNFKDEWVIVLNDTRKCKFVEKIAPTRKIWREENRDRTMNEVSRLKAMSYRRNGNAIANVKIFNPIDPLGEADSYNCPNEVFEELRALQKNKESILKEITILPENKDAPRWQ